MASTVVYSWHVSLVAPSCMVGCSWLNRDSLPFIKLIWIPFDFEPQSRGFTCIITFSMFILPRFDKPNCSRPDLDQVWGGLNSEKQYNHYFCFQSARRKKVLGPFHDNHCNIKHDATMEWKESWKPFRDWDLFMNVHDYTFSVSPTGMASLMRELLCKTE